MGRDVMGRAGPRVVGRARVGHARGRAPLPDRAPTGVLHVGAATARPVFVDQSGTRRRWVRRTAYLIGIVVLLALLVLWLSQLGNPVKPPGRACPATPPGAAASPGAGCRR